MNEIYRAIGTTKQNVHKRLNRYLRRQEQRRQLFKLIDQVRRDHPRMGALKMYQMLRPDDIGRDKFREIYNELGFRLAQPKNYRKTTDSNGVKRFDNLVEDCELTGINQVWVSDITYYELPDRFYYLTFIMDLYTRRLIGYQASDSLRTAYTTVPALQMALARLQREEDTGLIVHSDGGGQYYSKQFLNLTERYSIQNSMGRCVYENAHADRVHGTIKNDYIKPYDPQTFTELRHRLKQGVKKYNEQRPHEALEGKSPNMFEKELQEKNRNINNERRKKNNISEHCKPTQKTVNQI